MRFNLTIKLVIDAKIVEGELAKLKEQARELVCSRWSTPSTSSPQGRTIDLPRVMRPFVIEASVDFETGLPLYELSVAGIALGWTLLTAFVLVARRCMIGRPVLQLLLWAYLLSVVFVSLPFHAAILSGSLTICYRCPGPTSALAEVTAHAVSVLLLLLWPLAGLVPTYRTSNSVDSYLSLAVLLGGIVAISGWGLCALRAFRQKRLHQG